MVGLPGGVVFGALERGRILLRLKSTGLAVRIVRCGRFVHRD